MGGIISKETKLQAKFFQEANMINQVHNEIP